MGWLLSVSEICTWIKSRNNEHLINETLTEEQLSLCLIIHNTKQACESDDTIKCILNLNTKRK